MTADCLLRDVAYGIHQGVSLFFKMQKRFYSERINVASFTLTRKAQPYLPLFLLSFSRLSDVANFTHI
jgi:hypothetical protein